jgi:hypothetical protein
VRVSEVNRAHSTRSLLDGEPRHIGHDLGSRIRIGDQPAGELGQVHVLRAGVGAQEPQCVINGDAESSAEEALGLFHDDLAGKGVAERQGSASVQYLFGAPAHHATNPADYPYLRAERPIILISRLDL